MRNSIYKILRRNRVYVTWFFYFIIAGLFFFSLQQRNAHSLNSKPDGFRYDVIKLYKYANYSNSTQYDTLNKIIKDQSTTYHAHAQTALAWNVFYIIILPIFLLVIYFIYKSKISTNRPLQPSSQTEGPYHISLINNLKDRHVVLIAFILLLHGIEHFFWYTFVYNGLAYSLLKYLSLVTQCIYIAYAFLLIINLKFINALYNFFRHLLVYNTPILIFLAFLYLILTFNQGQNILLILTEHDVYTALFFIIINITAIWQWQLSKILQKRFKHNKIDIEFLNRNPELDYSDFSTEQENNYSSALFRKSIPRLLGVLVYLIPFYAFHKILHDSKVEYWASNIDASLLFFIPLFIIFVFLNSETISSRIIKSPRDWSKLWYTILFILFGLMLVLIYFANQDTTIKGLHLRASSLLLQMLFFIVLVMGRKYNRFIRAGAINFKLFITVCTTILFGLLALLWLHLAQTSFVLSAFTKFNILNIVISLALFWQLLVIILLQYGQRKKLSFITLAIVAVGFIIFSYNDKNYQLPTNTHTVHDYQKLMPDSTYIKQWLSTHHEHLIKTDSTIYLINGYGGGIRASAFFYFTIAEWSRAFQQKYPQVPNAHWMNNILSFSTASGSSLGSVKLVSDWVNNHQLLDSTNMLQFYKQDFLSSVIVSHVGSEFFLKLFHPHRLRDRLQAQNWTLLDTNLASSYYTFYQQHNTQSPLLFFNTTEGRSGRSAVLAPVQLSSNYYAGKWHVAKQVPQTDISLADAALLTARFPLLSPAMVTDKNEYYFDGGLSENSGCSTNLMVFNQLVSILKNNTTQYGHLKIKVISMHNTTQSTDTSYTETAQPTALVGAFINVGVNGSSETAENNLKTACERLHYPFKSYYITDSSNIILPLGWLLSDSAALRLYKNAQLAERPF